MKSTIDVKCITVKAGGVLVFKTTRQADGSWITINGPKNKKPKKRTGKRTECRKNKKKSLKSKL